MAGNAPSINETKTPRINQSIRDLYAGRSNAVGTLTLTANAASTTVDAANCGQDSRVFLMPTTAHAAAEIGAGTLYIGTVTRGQFVIHHANNTQTDRTFSWVALG